MTAPVPIAVVNGAPFFHEESNAVPSHRTPAYWKVTVWPDVTAGPVPLISGWTTSVVGASPFAGVMVGVPSFASSTVGSPAGGVTASPSARVGIVLASVTSIARSAVSFWPGLASSTRVPTFWPASALFSAGMRDGSPMVMWSGVAP